MTTSAHDHCVSALLVGEYESDRLLLQGIFHDAGWRLMEAPDRRRALDCLERQPVQVVISEKDGPQWHWKRVLNDLRRLAHPPQLIVTSRTADDYLWAEVLNIGGYDVLPQPFNRDEVERVVAAARRHFEGAEPASRPSAPLAAQGAA
jgi:DNA-binding response OmpR family regulator